MTLTIGVSSHILRRSRTSHRFNLLLWITRDTPGNAPPRPSTIAWQTVGMFWGVRNNRGQLYLVADDSAADAVCDEWERSGGQLVCKRPGRFDWLPAAPREQEWLREAATAARRARQALLGEMQP